MWSLGRRYAAGIRIATLVPIGIVAVLATGPDKRAVACVAVGIEVVWSVLYVAWTARRATAWPAVLDAVVLCGFAVLAAGLTPPWWPATGKSWTRPLVTFAAVGYQCSTRPRVGVPLGMTLCAVSVAATTVARPDSPVVDGMVNAVWSVVIPLLACLLFTTVRRAAERADAAFADAAAARRGQLVTATVQADEHMIADALHDTVATTLLLVALGRVEGLHDLLRTRARHDLDTLRMLRSGAPRGPADLCRELRAAADRVAVAVVVRGPDVLDVPPTVARALADATAEALTNVAKHAATTRAELTYGVCPDSGDVVVEIVDHGRGFDVDRVPVTRRGLRASIAARVEAVGGTCHVTSVSGAGTSVRLTWPA